MEVRQFECWYCHHILDRDVNAGRIVLVSAIAEEIRQDRPSMAKLKSENHSLAVPELKPDEREPTPTEKDRRALPMKRELDAPLQALEAHGFSRGRMSPVSGKEIRQETPNDRVDELGTSWPWLSFGFHDLSGVPAEAVSEVAVYHILSLLLLVLGVLLMGTLFVWVPFIVVEQIFGPYALWSEKEMRSERDRKTAGIY